MNIAIDISPLKTGHYLQHRVRGTGFYLQNLCKALEENYPENKYIYFKRGDKLKEKVDIFHYPYFEPFFLTLPLLQKNKTIITVHDLTPLVFPNHFKAGAKGVVKWWIQRRSLRAASAIITDSQSSKNDIVKYVDIEQTKIKVIYLAADPEFRILSSKEKLKQVREKYGLPQKFALYVGDATWNKNLPRLIKASLKINIPLVMVGKALIGKEIDCQNSWNKDLLTVQKMAEGNRNIFRLGFISKEDLIALYNAATVFAIPSLYEGFGLPVLEAMSCGCPVVTSKEGSLKEVAGEAAKYVDAHNTENIAEGISEVFNSFNLQKELSQKGLVQSKKFTWEKTALETNNLYKSVMNQ